MNKLDINIIDTHNNFTLAIADVSVYDNSPITNATLEVTPPGFNKISLPFYPRNMNTFNSNDVGITCVGDVSQLVELPDGMWQLTYSISPNSSAFINYYYIRTNVIECRLDNALLKLLSGKKDLDFIKEKRFLLDIRMLINGSIAAANKLDPSTAMEMYHKASNMIDTFNNRKCKDC